MILYGSTMCECSLDVHVEGLNSMQSEELAMFCNDSICAVFGIIVFQMRILAIVFTDVHAFERSK